MPAPVDPTAVIAAAARALETQRDERLIDDPYASRLVEAAGGIDLTQFPESLIDRVRDSNAIRSRFLDDVIADPTTPAGQVVLLGAGLDARPWRLAFHEDTTVYRLDLPGTVNFTTEVLGAPAHSAAPTVVNVASDLCEDWAKDLSSAGFNSSRPTFWIAEGVLFYLTSAEVQATVSTAAEMSVAGSVFSFAHFGPAAESDAQTETMASTAGSRGAPFVSTVTRPEDLLRVDQWDMLTATTIANHGAQLGRPLPYEESTGQEVTWLAAARRRE